MTDFRNLPNGDKFAPHRGRPPEPPEGYCRDERDPFLFHPIISECEYRVPYEVNLNCGRNIPALFCDFKGDDILLKECIKCLDLQNQ